jgi:SUMO ligase MMS21 Smc5/6 complex component
LKKEERNSGREVRRTRKDNQVSFKESIRLLRCGLAMEKRRRVRRKFLQHKTEQIKRNNKRSKKLCRGKRKTRARKEYERN